MGAVTATSSSLARTIPRRTDNAACTHAANTAAMIMASDRYAARVMEDPSSPPVPGTALDNLPVPTHLAVPVACDMAVNRGRQRSLPDRPMRALTWELAGSRDDVDGLTGKTSPHLGPSGAAACGNER